MPISPDSPPAPTSVRASTVVVDIHGMLDDPWQIYAGNAEGLSPGAAVLLPIEEWIDRRRLWADFSDRIGVLLTPADDPMRLRDWIGGFALIAVDFPKFTDGRGLSLGRLIRTRLGYGGPLRAIGGIEPDLVPFLARCGFDQFGMRDERSALLARRLMVGSIPRYQAAADGPADVPLPGQRELALARS